MSGRPDITGHGFPTIAPLTPVARIPIRTVSDGAGPSHLIPIGEYLLVVDPWDAAIRRYRIAEMAAPPIVTTMPRDFPPWRSRRVDGGIALIAEPYGPEEDGSYHLRPRAVMTIRPEAVAAMQPGAACGFPIDPAVPSLDCAAWHAGEGTGAARFPLNSSAFAALTPIGGANAEIYAVRHAGTLSRGRSLLWWSEVDGQDFGFGGRVTASHYVGIFTADGGAPDAVIRVQTAAYAPLLPDGTIPVAALLVKPGFEYVAGTTDGARDMLWIMAAETEAVAPAFMLLGYDLDGLIGGAKAIISLVEGGSEKLDRNDPAEPAVAVAVSADRPPPRGPRAAWFDAVEKRLQREIAHRWQYPDGAATRPCGGADLCAVGANDEGALGIGGAFSHPVIDKIDAGGGAQWMRPRQLIGVTAGDWLRGVPYSIGGFDLADEFAAKLAKGYDGSTRDPPPIGHIREGLEWHGQDRHYPLGIDCSALVARIFGVGVRSTAEMVAGVDVPAASGGTYRLPRGPDGSCTEPVHHLRDILPGDLFLRDGHVVIYAGAMSVEGGRALRVFEASSRTGRVCEGVYDPTFFDGWWIVRMHLDGEGDCLCWIDDRGAR